jgi:hypothetical protein
MPEFFIYLLKVNASLVLFCLAYYLVLRRLTFYNLNRVFLFTGIAFSTLYPLVNWSQLFKTPANLVIPITNALPFIITADVSPVDYWWIAKAIFWTGAAFMSLRFMIQLFSLYKIHRNSIPGQVGGYAVRLVKSPLNTFSFWQHIYLNPALHQPEALPAVLEHEQVHVQELHTVDILLAELATVFYWFNPGVWYLRKAVKENVEFITDQQLLKKGVDRKAYQYSMLHVLTDISPSVLMNNFNLTGIKRRIMMMNSKQSSALHLSRYILLLPVLLLLSTAFTFIRAEVKVPFSGDTTNASLKQVVLQDTSKKAAKKTVSSKQIKQPAKADAVKKVNVQPAQKAAKAVNAEVAAGIVKADSALLSSAPAIVVPKMRFSSGGKDNGMQQLKGIKTFIDNVEATEEQKLLLDPNTIAEIKVNKAVDPSKSVIYIYTKKANQPNSPLKAPALP